MIVCARQLELGGLRPSSFSELKQHIIALYPAQSDNFSAQFGLIKQMPGTSAVSFLTEVQKLMALHQITLTSEFARQTIAKFANEYLKDSVKSSLAEFQKVNRQSDAVTFALLKRYVSSWEQSHPEQAKLGNRRRYDQQLGAEASLSPRARRGDYDEGYNPRATTPTYHRHRTSNRDHPRDYRKEGARDGPVSQPNPKDMIPSPRTGKPIPRSSNPDARSKEQHSPTRKQPVGAILSKRERELARDQSPVENEGDEEEHDPDECPDYIDSSDEEYPVHLGAVRMKHIEEGHIRAVQIKEMADEYMREYLESCEQIPYEFEEYPDSGLCAYEYEYSHHFRPVMSDVLYDRITSRIERTELSAMVDTYNPFDVLMETPDEDHDLLTSASIQTRNRGKSTRTLAPPDQGNQTPTVGLQAADANTRTQTSTDTTGTRTEEPVANNTSSTRTIEPDTNNTSTGTQRPARTRASSTRTRTLQTSTNQNAQGTDSRTTPPAPSASMMDAVQGTDTRTEPPVPPAASGRPKGSRTGTSKRATGTGTVRSQARLTAQRPRTPEPISRDEYQRFRQDSVQTAEMAKVVEAQKAAAEANKASMLHKSAAAGTQLSKQNITLSINQWMSLARVIKDDPSILSAMDSLLQANNVQVTDAIEHLNGSLIASVHGTNCTAEVDEALLTASQMQPADNPEDNPVQISEQCDGGEVCDQEESPVLVNPLIQTVAHIKQLSKYFGNDPLHHLRLFRMPTIQVSLGSSSVVVVARVDSGAPNSLMSVKYYEQFKDSITQCPLADVPDILKAYNESPITIDKGVLRVPVKIGKNTIYVNFMIIHNTDVPLIIGNEVLNNYYCALQYGIKSNQMTFNPTKSKSFTCTFTNSHTSVPVRVVNTNDKPEVPIRVPNDSPRDTKKARRGARVRFVQQAQWREYDPEDQRTHIHTASYDKEISDEFRTDTSRRRTRISTCQPAASPFASLHRELRKVSSKGVMVKDTPPSVLEREKHGAGLKQKSQ